MKHQLRITSDEEEDGQPVYDRIWHINSSADPACLSKAILMTMGYLDSGEVLFWVNIDNEQDVSVYLEDVLRVLQAKRTAWLPLHDSHSTTLTFAPAPQTEIVSETDYAHAHEAAAERKKVHKIVQQVAKGLLQRRSEPGHAFLPFWQQQVWCRHLAIRLLAAKTCRKVNVLWPILCA